jgi:hypothetical protein
MAREDIGKGQGWNSSQRMGVGLWGNVGPSQAVQQPQVFDDIALYWIKPVAAGYMPLEYCVDLAGRLFNLGKIVALLNHPKPA